MMSRNRFLSGLTWTLSVAALVWSLWIMKATHHQQRTPELSQIAESLQHLSSLAGADSKERKVIEQASRNLDGLADGAVLIEERALHITSFLMLLTLGFATLSLIVKAPPSLRPESPEVDSVDSYRDNFASMLSQTMEDLLRIKAKIALTEAKSTSDLIRPHQLDRESNDIVAIESQVIFIKHQSEALAEQNQKALENLRQLTGQADDFANFATASRLEWNSLSVKLAQFKEAQGHVRGKTEMLLKNQKPNQDLLTKALEFPKIHGHHSERAASDVAQMYSDSKSTTEIFGQLIRVMAESSANVDLSNKLVKGLSERAEEIVNIIDVIDDIAEQTNQLALNASIEAARAGEQGKGFAVVAGEVRSLAARSSTATRTITELLETIQTEANQASSCLEKTNSSVGNAHSRIQDVEYRCRETMNLSHKVGGVLSELMGAAKEHSEDIQTIEKQSNEISRMTQKLLRTLDDIEQLNSSVHQESNQLALHTDRISRLMSRHYFAVQYAERMSAGQTEGFRGLLEQSTQALVHSQNLRANWDEKFQSHITLVKPSNHDSRGANSSNELSRLAHFCQSNLEILRSRSPTLTRVGGDTDAGDDDLDLKSSTRDVTKDDSDPSMTSNLEKAS